MMNPERFETMPPAAPPTERPTTPTSAAPEQRERVEGKLTVAIAVGSLPSFKHPGRNEDAVLGHGDRLAFEREFPPAIFGEGEVRERFRQMVRAWGEAEAKQSGLLKELGIVGVFDGVSNGEAGNGQGLIGSRLAAKECAASLARAEFEDGSTSEALIAFEDALMLADTRASLFNDDHKDELKLPSLTTAMLARLTRGRDGRPQLACGYVGNGRLYRYRPEMRALTCLTIDDTEAGAALRSDAITKEQYDQVNAADSADDLPEGPLRVLKAHNNSFDSERHLVGAAHGALTPHLEAFDAEPGDVFFLMTDGAHRGQTDARLTALVNRNRLDPAEVLRESEDSKTNGDDVTVVKIEIK